jgi:hypothetical protein
MSGGDDGDTMEILLLAIFALIAVPAVLVFIAWGDLFMIGWRLPPAPPVARAEDMVKQQIEQNRVDMRPANGRRH